MRVRHVAVGLGLLAACKGGTEPPAAADLETVSASNQQTAPAGFPLAAPLAVIVRSADGGTVVRAAVRWSVVTGQGAAVSDTLTLSDGNGRAEVALTLGPSVGMYEVRATLVDVPDRSVSLAATATAPPALATVTPTTFSAGDTITLDGANLSGASLVQVAGQTARLLTTSATSLTAVAPACLAPGPVQIRVRIAQAFTNPLDATYAASQAPLALVPGEYASIDPAQLAGCATFAAAGAAGAQYLVAPQSVTGVPGRSAQYRLGGDSVVTALRALARPRPARSRAQQFHDLLRLREREVAARPRPASLRMQAAAAQVTRPQVGDRRTFKVCRAIPCFAVSDFTDVTGEARYVGDHAALFLDTGAPAGFTDTDIAEVGALFEETLYDVDTRAFGAESDIDQNGVVIILFTTAVNGLTDESQCSVSIITGYFFGIDIDPLFANDARSNKGEVFYALAPDPAGTVTCEFETAAVRSLVPVTFVHEFQHMISYNQHVLVRNGDAEALWLNEALSHTAEELAGLRFQSQGDDERFSRFVLGDLLNAYLFLEDPGQFFTLPEAGTGTLEERGAAWLFVRWMVDQFGEGITRRLVETDRIGAENVEEVVGEPVTGLLARWFLANYVSDLDPFDVPSELTFSTWQFRTTYESLHQQAPSRFERVFPIEPMTFTAGSFTFDGTLRSGSGDYFFVEQDPNGPGFTLQLTDPVGGAFGATTPRLNVIRIR